MRADSTSELTEPARVTTNGDACANELRAPTLLAPANGDVVKLGKVIFAWNAVECAKSYKWQLRADSSQGEVVATKKDLTTTETSIKKLDAGKTYAWRVWACKAEGNCAASEWWNIRVENTRPKK